MSLPWGGLFDINGDWSCLHRRHRLGRSVDVNHCLPDDAGRCLIYLGEKGGEWGRRLENVLDDFVSQMGFLRFEKREGRIHYEYNVGGIQA